MCLYSNKKNYRQELVGVPSNKDSIIVPKLKKERKRNDKETALPGSRPPLQTHAALLGRKKKHKETETSYTGAKQQWSD